MRIGFGIVLVVLSLALAAGTSFAALNPAGQESAAGSFSDSHVMAAPEMNPMACGTLEGDMQLSQREDRADRLRDRGDMRRDALRDRGDDLRDTFRERGDRARDAFRDRSDRLDR